MKTVITTILILFSINIFAQKQSKEINLSNKDLTEFVYNDTMKDVTYLDLSVNFLQDIKIDSMKQLVYINVCENILTEEAILNILKVLNKNGLTLGWCYLSGGGNAYINDLKINKDYLMLLRKRWNISINTNNQNNEKDTIINTITNSEHIDLFAKYGLKS